MAKLPKGKIHREVSRQPESISETSELLELDSSEDEEDGQEDFTSKVQDLKSLKDSAMAATVVYSDDL